MNGVDTVIPTDLNQGGDVQVGLDRFTRRADLISLVCFEPMQSITVLVRVDSDCADPQFGSAAEHSNSDFTTIGDK